MDSQWWFKLLAAFQHLSFGARGIPPRLNGWGQRLAGSWQRHLWKRYNGPKMWQANWVPLWEACRALRDFQGETLVPQCIGGIAPIWISLVRSIHHSLLGYTLQLIDFRCHGCRYPLVIQRHSMHARCPWPVVAWCVELRSSSATVSKPGRHVSDRKYPALPRCSIIFATAKVKKCTSSSCFGVASRAWTS